MSTDATPSFSLVRWREGYAIDEVDAFLADISTAVAGRLPDHDLAKRIATAQFSPVRMRPGYAMDEVDDHLDHLQRLASQGHSAG